MAKTTASKSSKAKVLNLGSILKIVDALRKKGRRIVTTNGCFDLIHPGHVATLEWARSNGDVLIVGIDSDRAVRANKGPHRPIVSAHNRALVLAGLTAVDYVFIFGSKNPIPWLKRIKPTIHVKGRGSEKNPRFIKEQEIIVANGGKVILSPKMRGLSTTGIERKILECHKS